MTHYAGDPTAKADRVVAEMRAYYEANKPLRWWQRRQHWSSETADELMIGLLNIALNAYADTPKDAPALDSEEVVRAAALGISSLGNDWRRMRADVIARAALAAIAHLPVQGLEARLRALAEKGDFRLDCNRGLFGIIFYSDPVVLVDGPTPSAAIDALWTKIGETK